MAFAYAREVPTVEAPPRVLVVDDSDVLRFSTRLALEAVGWEVAEAATAAECLEIMEPTDPDVVLLDLGLPDADGFSVLTQLKESERTSWVPVVVLSGRSERREVSRLLLAGAQDYLVKPVMGDELNARLVAARRVAVEHRRLAKSEGRWRVAFDSAPVAMAEVDVTGRCLEVNGALCDLVGYRNQDLIGSDVSALCLPEDAREFRDLLRATASGEMSLLRIERRFRRADNRDIWVAVSVAPVFDEHGQVSHMLSHYLDITDRKRVERELEDLADHDALTGLLNRRGFDTELERHINLVSRSGPAGALLVLDLDHFKRVNDTWGHQAGDRVIAAVAECLRSGLRRSDVVARLGGDEFGIILPHATSREAQVVAAKLIRAVRECPVDGMRPGELRTTASVGIALFDDATRRGQEILARADLSMYRAKDAGRDRYSNADDSRDTTISLHRSGTTSFDPYALRDDLSRAQRANV
jgi:diguanylate cyclase (GGDEF)-like protein/PAS domain S-box-containing protein